jgi:signal transduction histidine kinase
MGRRPPTGDLALALALGAAAQVEIWVTSSRTWDSAVEAACALVANMALAWRRTHPTVSVLVCLGALLAGSTQARLGYSWVVGDIMIATFSIARHAATRPAVAGLTAALVLDASIDRMEANESFWIFLGNFLFAAVLITAFPWTAGRALRQRALRGERDAETAVGQERLRIARELHDVVGHALGVIVVQAGAERATLPAGAPASARETLATIEQTARQALTEMRRLLAVLRSAEALNGDDRAPQPSLEQVPGLLHRSEAAGLRAELHIEGEPVPLAPGVDLSAYRAIQEALTNVLRHAGPAPRARITIRYLENHLELEIIDDGRGAGKEPGATGYGLAGMRERIALYGGSVATGSRLEGGFAVRVSLPYAAVAR